MSSSGQSHILNELAFRLLHASNKDEPVCISPLAILGNLNLVLQSTTSQNVIQQIDQVLHFNADEKKKKQDEKIKLISDLITHIENGDKEFVQFHQENGVCFPSGMALENLAAFKNIKFCKDEGAIKCVNEEVEKLTNHKVKDFLNSHNKPKTGITLFNFIQLKAPFCNIFRPDSTEIGEFHVNPSKTIKIAMLKAGGMVMYNEDKEIGARVMYHSFLGCNFSILAIVPSKKFGLAEMEKKLTAEKYSHLTGNMRSVLGSLSIPKLALNNISDISSSLKSSGLADLFDASAAHLSKLTKSNVAVDHISQGISINLNEFGSNVPKRELKESELYGMCCGGFTEPPEQQDVTANEPFLLLIHYHIGNSVVSINRVLEPVYSE